MMTFDETRSAFENAKRESGILAKESIASNQAMAAI